MYSILFTPSVVLHLQEAILYLEKQQEGLGKKFYRHFLAKIKVLETHPRLPVLFDNIMCLHLKKYRYRIHYIIIEKKKQVKLLALFHSSRNPKIWK